MSKKKSPARDNDMDSPLFSVIVASYNYEHLVVETLASLSAQTFRDFEVIVVDDGSQDNSVEEIRRYIDGRGRNDVDVRLVTHPGGVNKGLPATVELGVHEARGRYIAFCESDDLWMENHLEEVAKVINATNSRFIVNDVEIFGDKGRCEKMERIRKDRILKEGRNRISPVLFAARNYVLTFSAVAVRTDCLLKCDFSPVVHPAALDWWLWRQIAYDNPVYFIARKLTKWRMHNSYICRESASVDLWERNRAFIRAGTALLCRQHPWSSKWWAAQNNCRRYLRGCIKRCVPYALQRNFANRKYRMSYPDFGFGWAILPFGLVCALKGFDPDTGLFEPKYRFSRSRRRKFLEARNKGLLEFRDIIKKNRDVRILVVLHLFYPQSWSLIKMYLDNLNPYVQTHFVITYISGTLSDRLLNEIRSYSPNLELLPCENRGFDIGPFAEALKNIDLNGYDIVFKLHSKGIKRPSIFIYDQIFKYADWFFNLWDGVLWGDAVHQVIDGLVNGEIKLSSAENLIVHDPVHKCNFLRAFCKERALPFVEGYRYVAGSMFAIRADCLKPFKALELGLDDFGETKRGTFSLAHALERWICFSAQGRLHGVPVSRNLYTDEVAKKRATSALRLYEDPRIKLNDDFFYRTLETRPVRDYKIEKMILKDIKRKRHDGSIVSLEECEPYRYLAGEIDQYNAYCDMNRKVSGFEMSECRFTELAESMSSGYDPRYMPVVKEGSGVIYLMDGQHRCCLLLRKFGPEHEIDVLKLS